MVIKLFCLKQKNKGLALYFVLVMCFIIFIWVFSMMNTSRQSYLKVNNLIIRSQMKQLITGFIEETISKLEVSLNSTDKHGNLKKVMIKAYYGMKKKPVIYSLIFIRGFSKKFISKTPFEQAGFDYKFFLSNGLKAEYIGFDTTESNCDSAIIIEISGNLCFRNTSVNRTIRFKIVSRTRFDDNLKKRITEFEIPQGRLGVW